jgi:hypothetical protein
MKWFFPCCRTFRACRPVTGGLSGSSIWDRRSAAGRKPVFQTSRKEGELTYGGNLDAA